MQSMDSASNACSQNPACCTAAAGEEPILPIPVGTGSTFVPPQTTAPAKEPASEGTKDKTTEMTWQEIKKNCDEGFTRCLDTAVQSQRGPLYKHSQCAACRDVCVQNKGVWPAEANEKACP